jgi:hypothetical protein
LLKVAVTGERSADKGRLQSGSIELVPFESFAYLHPVETDKTKPVAHRANIAVDPLREQPFLAISAFKQSVYFSLEGVWKLRGNIVGRVSRTTLIVVPKNQCVRANRLHVTRSASTRESGAQERKVRLAILLAETVCAGDESEDFPGLLAATLRNWLVW